MHQHLYIRTITAIKAKNGWIKKQKLKHHKMNRKKKSKWKENWLKEWEAKKREFFMVNIYNYSRCVFITRAGVTYWSSKAMPFTMVHPRVQYMYRWARTAWEILMKCRPCVEYYDKNVLALNVSLYSQIFFTITRLSFTSLHLCNMRLYYTVYSPANESQSDVLTVSLIFVISFIHLTSE